MSGFVSQESGIAASIFLAIYTLYLGLTTYILVKKGFRSVYTSIWFFTVFRFSGQLCGVVYAKLGPNHWQWLIAYLVLGAEGYFALIFAAFRFTTRGQVKETGVSWVTSTGPSWGRGKLAKTWSGLFHMVLIPANALVITGGSMLAGISDLSQQNGDVTTSRILRTVGQSLFVSMSVILIILNFYVYFYERVRNHFTVTVMIAGPFLIVRGIFGILAIYITQMNYFQLSNYLGNGVNHHLVIFEYVLSTTMEFIASVALILNYFFDQDLAPKKFDIEVSSSELNGYDGRRN